MRVSRAGRPHSASKAISMNPALTAIEELLRIPAPAAQPQALACDGEHLWLGSWATARIYGIDPVHGTVFEETDAPGKPVGGVAIGDELRFVCSEEENSRFIRRYVPGRGFKDHERMPCPDDTGSFLGYDGVHLWLSQRFNKRVLQLDDTGTPMRSIEIGAEIVGLAIVDTQLYLSTWHGRDAGGCRIARVGVAQGAPVEYVASVPFVAIALAFDGTRLWTNDFKKNAIVAFGLPR